jgi:hypothetical protein
MKKKYTDIHANGETQYLTLSTLRQTRTERDRENLLRDKKPHRTQIRLPKLKLF